MSHPLLPQRTFDVFRAPALATAFARIRAAEPALVWTAVAHAALAPVMLALMPFDGRTILGIDPWIKPLKFFLSVSIYTITVAFLLQPLRPGRATSFVRWATIAPLAVENAIISLQSARGVTSHFNDATSLDAALFGAMGLAILVVTASMVVLFVLHARSRSLAPSLRWAILGGIAISLAGSAVGGAMVSREGHTVGAEDGGEGLPLVNWSRDGGDLRIAHFAGLHALQTLPLIGLAARGSRRAGALVLAATLAHAAIVGALFAQAMLGRPLVG